MPADPFLPSLAVKMAVTAAFVVTAALIAERVGALVGAMVATLPIAAGPAYILLSLDHDAQFIADSTVASLAAHAATGVFGTTYVFAAQRHPVFVAVPVALGVWFACAFLIRSVEWSLPAAILVCAASYAICIVLVGRFLHVAVPPFASRWLDIPLRALLVASLVGTVVLLGANAGPKLTGIFAIFPIVMLSLMLILHPRIGGPATAAIIANTMWGLVGFASAILALHLAVVPLGAPAGLAVALAVSFGANIAIFMVRRRGHAAATAALKREAAPKA